MKLLLLLVICIALPIVLFVNSEVIYDSYNYNTKTAVTPLRYDIYLALDNHPYDFKSYNGTVRIQLISNIESNQLIFHYNQTNGRQIDVVKLINLNKSSEINDFRISYFEYENNSYTALESERDNFLEVNNLYSLSVAFQSPFVEGYNKAFFKNCHIVDGLKRCYAATQFEITHIRETVPCFDEINFKTYFNVHIKHHRDLEAISNMPVKEIIPNEDESVTTIFEETPLMSTYILAFAVGNFNKMSIPSETNVTINIYTSPGSGQLTPILVQHTARILKMFENYFGINYALPKLDFLIIDGYDIVGMENWGLIIVSDTEFIQDMTKPSLQVDDISLSALAHELSHQFFGNLVTIKERKSLFLSEGFATYFASRISNDISPTENYADRNMIVEQIKALHFEKILPQTILNNFHPNDTIQETLTSYLKGGCFVRMLNNVLGERSFRQMIVNYMEKYKFGSVTTDDLIDEISIANRIDNYISDDIDIAEFINSWINQDKFPIVTVTRNYDTGTVEFHQDRYQEQSDVTWWIPLNYITRNHLYYDSTVPEFWIKNTRQMSIPLDIRSDEWIIINKNAAYYYVVLYDDRNLELIAEALANENYDGIQAIDRAKLIGDIGFLLVMDQQFDTTIVRNLLRFMCHDSSYITWSVFQLVMRYWHVNFKNKEYQVIFTETQAECSKHLYDHYGAESSQNDSREKQLVQVLAVKLACNNNYEKCLNDIDARSREYLHAMITNSFYYITREMLEEIFAHGFRADEDLEQIFKYIQSSSNEDLKNLFNIKFYYHSKRALYRKYFVPTVYNLKFNEVIDPILRYEFKYFDDKIERVRFFTLCIQENCYDFNQNYPNVLERTDIISNILDKLITDLINDENARDPIAKLLDTIEQNYSFNITEPIRYRYSNYIYGNNYE